MDLRDEKQRLYFIFFGLILLSIAAYEPMRWNDFVNFDDPVYVTANANVAKGFSLKSITWAFRGSHYGTWHPLTSLSHMLDCQLFGLRPFWHHFNSLLLHIGSSLVLFWILRKMTGADWASAFVAAVFAVHPLNVESVAWVSERKSVLSGFFWMLTILAYINYVRRPNLKGYLLVVFVFCLALMSKPMVVTLPFVLLLLDYWPLRRIVRSGGVTSEPAAGLSAGRPAYQKFSFGRLIAEKVPLLVLSAILSVVTFYSQQRAGLMAHGDVLALKIRLMNVPVSYIGYLNKMIYPVGLSVFYPFSGQALGGWFLALVKLGIITAIVMYVNKKRGYPITGWLWYLGVMVPVIGFVQVGFQPMADRYAYLPLIGIFIIVVWGLAEVSERWRQRAKVLSVLGGIVIVLLVGVSRAQVRVWRDSVSLYEHAVKITDGNYMMHGNYGGSLFKAGRLEEAEQQFRKALEINPDYAKCRYNLGLVLTEQGKYDEAIEQFDEVLSEKGEWFLLYVCKADAYYRKGDKLRAMEVLEDAASKAEAIGRSEMAGRLRKRIERYQQLQQTEESAGSSGFDQPQELTEPADK